MTRWGNWQVNQVFEYLPGNFVVLNLTDQLRRSNPGIGRNTRATAELEAILLNPATQGDVQARFDAAMKWVTTQASLAPFSGLNAVSSADWLRWRELGVTYTVPRTFSERLGLNNLQINLTGRNLKLWSKYDGTDPETNARGACGGGGAASSRCILSQGLDSMGLPIATRYAISLRFGFLPGTHRRGEPHPVCPKPMHALSPPGVACHTACLWGRPLARRARPGERGDLVSRGGSLAGRWGGTG